MGAWGYGPFENDDALDWLVELEAGDSSTLRDSLVRVAMDGGPPGSSDAAVAVAAACLVAQNAGDSVQDLPPEAIEWLSDHPPGLSGDLPRLALDAVTVVMDRSELKELWEESGELEQWIATVEGLRRRLEWLAAHS